MRMVHFLRRWGLQTRRRPRSRKSRAAGVRARTTSRLQRAPTHVYRRRSMKWLALVSFVVACSSDHHAGPDAAVDVSPDTGFAPAQHTPLPVVIPHNHTVLKNVSLVTITYANYPDRAAVDAFGDA